MRKCRQNYSNFTPLPSIRTLGPNDIKLVRSPRRLLVRSQTFSCCGEIYSNFYCGERLLLRYFKLKTAFDQTMASDDVISDCGSELEESEASFTVDYEMEFEGLSDLVESNLYTDRGRTRSLCERTIDRHKMVYEEERKKNWKKLWID